MYMHMCIYIMFVTFIMFKFLIKLLVLQALYILITDTFLPLDNTSLPQNGWIYSCSVI